MDESKMRVKHKVRFKPHESYILKLKLQLLSGQPVQLTWTLWLQRYGCLFDGLSGHSHRALGGIVSR